MKYNESSKRNAHVREQNKILELLDDEFCENFCPSEEGFEILYNQIRDLCR